MGDKGRRKPLAKKILAISLTILVILPVISLAEEIEIGDIKLEWREDFATAFTFWAKIPVVNYANHEYRVIGKLLFYDEDGIELYGIPFWGDVEAMERKVLQATSLIPSSDYGKIASLKVAIEVNPLSPIAWGKSPFRMEKALTFPPRNNHSKE
jgi:hypothetical protein